MEEERFGMNIVESGLNIQKKTNKARMASAKPGSKPAAMNRNSSQPGVLETSVSGEDATWLTATQVQEPQIVHQPQPQQPSAAP